MTDKQKYDVFLSYNSLDHVYVERVAKELKARHCESFIDRWYLTPGHDWVVALERALQASRSVAIFLGPHEMGRWQQRERAWALDQLAGREDFPVIPVLLPGCEPPLDFLKQLMWIDLRTDPASGTQLDALANAIRGDRVDLNGQLQPRSMICPYRGLMPFREEDADFFFGRDLYQQQLVSLVERQTLVAVVGASGSGKSSLVSAGLVKKLRQNGDGPVWDFVRMVPHVDPLYSLAQGLVPLIEPDLSPLALERELNAVANDLEQASPATPLWGLVNAVLRQQPGTERLLLFVDQWEELYTNCENPKRRERFIQELLEATARKDSPLTVVLTVRGDFYTEILNDRPLLDRIQSGRLDLGPMNTEELRSTIEGPASKVDLTFQAGLVDRILKEAGEEPGSLPLLEFALEELWKRRDGFQLTHAAYEDLGRQAGQKDETAQPEKGGPLSRAIATYAEGVYLKLKPEEQQALPTLFRKLVRAGSRSEEDTRRRIGLQELDATTQRVTRELARQRLLMTTGSFAPDMAGDKQAESPEKQLAAVANPAGENSVGTTVEVAHEELLRRWGRLKEWVNEDRQFLQWRSRIELKVDEYRRDGDAALLRDRPLQDAKKYYPARANDLEGNQSHFLDLCLKAEKKRRRRFVGMISSALLLLMAIFGVTWNVVSSERQKSLKGQLVALVDSLQNSSGPAVAYGLRDLRKIGHDNFVLEEIRSRYEEIKLPCKLALAYGLADFGEVDIKNIEYLCSQIPVAAPSEVDNLATALRKSKSESLKELKRLAKKADESQDWRLKTRLAVVGLHLQDDEIAREMCQIYDRPDPVQRTTFIDAFPAWHGQLVTLAKSCQERFDPAVRSGILLGIGGVSSETVPSNEREEIIEVLLQFYKTAPESLTHSSAGWALRQWSPADLSRVELPKTSQPAEGRDWFVNSLGMTMLQIQPGSFVRKDPDRKNAVAQKVTLTQAYFLSDREITVAPFQKCIDDRNCRPEDKPENFEGPDGTISPTRDHPVQQVSWSDAVMFCNWLSRVEKRVPCYERIVEKSNEWRLVPEGTGYRLPTEAEWEYACRAGSETDYCFGSDKELLRKYATFASGVESSATACGEKLPSEWGLFDIHGNIFEWCHDRLGKYGSEDAKNPFGPLEGRNRVLRGGGWSITAQGARSAYRYDFGPGDRSDYVGFRCAQSSSDKAPEAKGAVK